MGGAAPIPGIGDDSASQESTGPSANGAADRNRECLLKLAACFSCRHGDEEVVGRSSIACVCECRRCLLDFRDVEAFLNNPRSTPSRFPSSGMFSLLLPMDRFRNRSEKSESLPKGSDLSRLLNGKSDKESLASSESWEGG